VPSSQPCRRTLALAIVVYQSAFWLNILIPFDFHWPESFWPLVAGRTESYSWQFFLAASGHCAFFVPWGVLSARAQRRRNRWLIFGTGLVVAGGSEFSQMFVTRGVSVGDLTMDVFGLILGFAAARCYNHRSGFRRRIDALFSPTLISVALGVVVLVFAVATRVGSVDLTSWDLRFPLVLGNEADGKRPWHGELSSVAIFDRAFESRDIANLPESLAPGDVLRYRPVVYYALEQQREDPSGRWLDDSASDTDPLPLAIEPADRRLGTPAGGGLLWHDGVSASSRVPARLLSERVGSRGAMSVVVALRATVASVYGPARIVTLSGSTLQRNFTLGQEGRDLHFRVRNSATDHNGMDPHLVARDVLEIGRRQLVVAVTDARGSWLYVDGVLAGVVGYSLYSRFETGFLGSPHLPGVYLAESFAVWFLLILAFGFVLRRRLGYGARLEVAAVLFATLALAAFKAWRWWSEVPL
jgi:hypothetical protein